MARLAITLSDGRTLSHDLRGLGSEVIGRDPTCDIWVDDPSMSRRHAQFRKTAEGYLVEDLGSKNGTSVNDQPSASHLLRDNDLVTLGAVEVRYHLEPTSLHSSTIIVTDQSPEGASEHYSNPGATIRLSQQRLQILYDLSDRLVCLKDRDQLLSDAMDICFEMLHCERGAIAVRQPGSRTIDWPVVRNLRGKEGELTISRTTLTRALEHGERAIVTEDTLRNADPTVSMIQHGIRSAMCVPLIYNNEILGVIYGDRVSTAAVYTPEDVDFMAAIARQVSIGLINGRLLDEQRIKLRLEKDLALAREIQNGLLPRDLPARADIIIAASNEPGNRVSGDYYDVIDLPDGRTWIIIADVTGEGVAAALLMANLQAAVRVTIDSSEDPAELMTRWNRLIYQNTDSSKFVTALLGLIDPAGQKAVFTTAGHFPPFIIRPDGSVPVEVSLQTGFPLGVIEDAKYESQVVELAPTPCTLFCYTDGVTEARCPDDRMFGAGRLIEQLSSCENMQPSAVITSVRQALTKFCDAAPQGDDITMLAVSLPGNP